MLILVVVMTFFSSALLKAITSTLPNLHLKKEFTEYKNMSSCGSFHSKNTKILFQV